MEFIAAAFLALYMCFAPVNFETVIQVETPNIVIQDLQSELYKSTIQVIEEQEALINKSPSLSDSDKENTLTSFNFLERELKKAQRSRKTMHKQTEIVQVFHSEGLTITIKKSQSHTNDSQSIFDKLLLVVSQK